MDSPASPKNLTIVFLPIEESAALEAMNFLARVVIEPCFFMGAKLEGGEVKGVFLSRKDDMGSKILLLEAVPIVRVGGRG